MWPFKSKYDKLTREEVVDAICHLEKESASAEEEILSFKVQINNLMEKGKKEKDKEIQVFYAKKINALKEERAQCVQHALYLLYNIRLLNKLKQAIDDNKFFHNTSNASLGNLLSDQKGLAAFLNQSLNTRLSSEKVLTDADETFKALEEAYEKNESIYDINDNDDSLLAMFEIEEQLQEEESRNASENKQDNSVTEANCSDNERG